MAARTSSSARPSEASLAGSTWMRTAGFCWPPIPTWPTPAIWPRCCARMVSAYSSTLVSGSRSDCTASTMIGASPGLTLRYCGGAGRLAGSWPEAWLMADWMSSAAPSMLRLRSNCTVMVLVPRMLVEVMLVTPGIWPNCRSSGAVTELAMVSGLAPGSLVLTLMVGKSTCGSGATGSSG